MKNKTESLEILLLQYDPHVAVLTETWLNEEICDNDIFPPSYTVFRKDRQARGGGVAILVKDSVQAVLLDDVVGIESLRVKISIWGQSFMLYALYRPPDATTND